MKTHFFPAVSELYRLFKRIIFPFIIVTFIIYSLLYIIPGSIKMDAPWPMSYLLWAADFLAGTWFTKELGMAFLYTIQLVFGSLVLSAVIVLSLYFAGRRQKTWWVRFLNRLVKVSSGFHVLILSIVIYIFFPSIREAGPFNIVLLLILAFGNGSIAEFYNSVEAEYDKIFQKEYTLAAVTWGHNVYRYSLREMVIIMAEMLNARIPIAISSTIIVEWLFNLDGMSYLILYSIKHREYGNLMLSTALIALTIIVLNVITEQIRTRLDPRVRNL